MKPTSERERLGLQAGAPARGLLGEARYVHFIGIGGIGMSAIAHLLLDKGVAVTGSDLTLSPVTAALEAKGAAVHGGHAPSLVEGADLVVVSTAVPPDNAELRHATDLGVPILTRGETLARLAQGHQVIAVAGTHGKTTTTAMLAMTLIEAGQDPTVLVGGIIPQIDGQARLGSGTGLLVEADEYQRSFLALEPYLVLVTHIEFDHPDYFADAEDVFAAFKQLAERITPEGLLYSCADHPLSLRLAAELGEARAETYGLTEGAHWRALHPLPERRGGHSFEVAHRGRSVCRVSIPLPGLHNVRNAVGALAAAHALGVEPKTAAGVLEGFVGVERRFQLLGEVAGATVIDDYAHHPTEISTTVAAARERFPGRRLWALFQPHTFSRTLALLNGFSEALRAADRAVISDIYPARELDTGAVHGRDLASQIGPSATYGGSLGDTEEMLAAELQPGDVLLVMGAGDIWQVGEGVLNRLRETHGER